MNTLHGFDVLHDLVFYAVPLIFLNIVKRRVQQWLSNGILNKEEFGSNAETDAMVQRYSCHLYHVIVRTSGIDFVKTVSKVEILLP